MRAKTRAKNDGDGEGEGEDENEGADAGEGDCEGESEGEDKGEGQGEARARRGRGDGEAKARRRRGEGETKARRRRGEGEAKARRRRGEARRGFLSSLVVICHSFQMCFHVVPLLDLCYLLDSPCVCLLFGVVPFCFAVLLFSASVCWLLFVCLSVRWLRCSTSLPGGNQVDGLPPASQFTDPVSKSLLVAI